MIFAVFLVGAMLVSSAVRGTTHELGQMVQGDLLGQDGFIAWIAAVAALGAIGFIPGLRDTSRYLVTLIMVVVIVRNGGLFSNIETALQSASSAGPAPSVPTLQTSGDPAAAGSTGSSGSSGSSGSGVNAQSAISDVIGIAAVAAAFL